MKLLIMFCYYIFNIFRICSGTPLSFLDTGKYVFSPFAFISIAVSIMIFFVCVENLFLIKNSCKGILHIHRKHARMMTTKNVNLICKITDCSKDCFFIMFYNLYTPFYLEK